jgi:hypothetical protein
MTDQDPSLDELVSAHLDGEATAEESAHVEEDAALQARLERFAAVRDAVRADVPSLPDDERDALLTRVVGAAMAPPKVESLDSRRRMTSRVLAAAAAIIAVVFLGGALAMIDGRDGDGDDDSASSGASATTLAEGAESATDGAFSTSGADPEESAPGATAYASLGSFPDAEALRDAVEQQRQAADAGGEMDQGSVTEDDSGFATTMPSTGGAGDQSPRTAAGCAAPSGVAYLADIAGRPVVAVVEPTTVYVLDAATCATVATFAR